MSLGDQLRALLRRISGADSAGPVPPAPGEDPGSADAVGPAAPRTPRVLGPRDTAILASATRCTACGVCDVAFDGYERVERPTFRGPSELPLTYARHLAEASATKRYLESLYRGNLEALTRVCPVGVPFSQLADVIERQATAGIAEAPSPETERARHDPG